jgi:Sulfotransferase domain
MIQYWMPLGGKPAKLAPSLLANRRGVGTKGTSEDSNVTNGAFNGTNGVHGGEVNNPTIVPEELLRKFHFTFLIRHPRSSIPSYYRCTIPPLDKVTGFYDFRPEEAGYAELRKFFDYAREVGIIGPRKAAEAATNGATNGAANGVANGVNGTAKHDEGVEICLIDADDLLDNPYGVIEAYCKSVGITYSPQMLKWGGEEHKAYAKSVFEKWNGFHEDAIHSTELKPRTHVSHPFSIPVV